MKQIIIVLGCLICSTCGEANLIRDLPLEVDIGLNPKFTDGDVQTITDISATEKSIAVSVPLTITGSSFLITIAYVIGGVVLFLITLVIIFASLWQRNSRSGRRKRNKND